MYLPDFNSSHPDVKNSVLAIANPQAGGGRAIRHQQRWQSRLPDGCQVVFSQFPGHAEELARAASCEQRRLVIAVGGDGTFHEVLNGLLSHEGNTTELGILPLGTADDFAVSLSLQIKQQQADSLVIDVGLVEWNDHRRYFGNVLGIGLTGRVAQAARRSPGLPARLRYSLALIRSLWGDIQSPMVRLSYDDGAYVEQPLLSLTVASGMRE